MEKDYDLIEVLEELKLDKNKVFKSKNEAGMHFKRYAVIENRFVIINFRNEEVTGIEDIRLSNTFKNINKLRYVEVKQFNKNLKVADEYFYINKDLEIKKAAFLKEDKRTLNMFRNYSEAEKSLEMIIDILKVN
ncbi:MAG: hypothetical protein ACRCWG_02945 [Sarcina sp.]